MNHSCKLWDELTTNTAGIEINGEGEINSLCFEDDDPSPIPSLKFRFCPYCGDQL